MARMPRGRRPNRSSRRCATHPKGGHELTVEVPKRKLLGFGNAQVLIRVRGPHGLDLDAATASADVVVTGRPRCADVRTASGDVSIEAADGAVQVKTASGDVDLGHMRDATDVKTMSGDVIVRESGSATDVNTMSGNVRDPPAAAGAIQMRSMSGDVEVAIAAAPPCSSTPTRRPETSARRSPSRGARPAARPTSTCVRPRCPATSS